MAGTAPNPDPSSAGGTRCPACAEPLESFQEQGFTLLGCARCSGIWLWWAELQTARYLTPATLAALDARLGWGSGPPGGAPPGGARACPLCRQSMEEIAYGESRGVRIDRCRPCGGLWLDPGELVAIQLGPAAGGTQCEHPLS